MRRATSLSIHQSGLASPGAGRNARWREMQRSELVTVPSFSPQAAAGRTTSAKHVVSVGQQSLTATIEFVGDEAGEEIDGGHGFGLSLAQASFEHGGDTSQAKLS